MAAALGFVAGLMTDIAVPPLPWFRNIEYSPVKTVLQPGDVRPSAQGVFFPPTAENVFQGVERR